METMGILFSLIGFLLPIIVLGVVVYIIVLTSKNKEKNSKFVLSSKLLFQIYLYALSFITLGIMVIGGSMAIKAALSYSFDIPFSYTLQTAGNAYYSEPDLSNEKTFAEKQEQKCYSGKPVTYWNTTFCFDNNLRKSDLINGLSLFISMIILFSLHQYAINKTKFEDIIEWIKKVYTFASLILFSVVSVVSIPTSIYLTVSYLLFEQTENMYTTPTAPAMAIGVSLLAIPLWIYFLRETTKLKEE